MAKRTAPKRDYAKEVAEELIGQIKEGTAPWQKPWEPGQTAEKPRNAVTGQEYRGFNSVWLQGQQPDSDPRWATYKQAQEAGAQVRKGEKGTPICRFVTHKEITQKDENGKPIKDPETGKTRKSVVQLEKPFMKWHTVFHASQIDGLAPYQAPEKAQNEWERHERCESILKESGAHISHKAGDMAFYSSGADRIVLPEKEQFPSADGYYATALHELGHWTGHPDRLDRDLSGKFGSVSYAKEELRAEISSMMVGRELGIGHDPGQHAAYAASWVKVLQEDPNEIFRASTDANKIKDYVLGFDKSLDQNQVQNQSPDQDQAPESDKPKEPERQPDDGARSLAQIAEEQARLRAIQEAQAENKGESMDL